MSSKPAVTEAPQIHSQQQQIVSNDQFLTSVRLQVAPPPPPQTEPEWFYTDPQQQVQGPFSQENMKLWHEAGYFSKDLPIKLKQWSGFHAFYLVFPDLSRAFTSVPSEVRPNVPSMPALSSVHSLEHIHALEQQRQQQHLREQQLFEQRQAEEAYRQQQQIEQQLHQQRVAEQQAAADAAAARRSREVRVDVSGPPPLTPVTLDNKLLTQQQAIRNVVAPSASTPPPLDSLRKIRISTNIGELNQKAAPSVETAVVGETPKKISVSSGPPPLTAERSREVVVSVSSAAPWAASAHGGKASGSAKDSLVAIQNVEKERALADKSREAELRQSKSSKNWTSGSPVKAQTSASLADIQVEESKQREKQRALAESRQPVAAPLTMSSQLKSLLGVRPAGNGVVASASPLAPKQWAASSSHVSEAVQSSGAIAPSLRDIMQQEEKQAGPVDGPVASGSGGAGRKQPLSWAAKASTGVNATNLLPTQSQISSQASVQTTSKAPLKPVVVVAAPIKQRDISVGADFGGKGMSREMAEWCTAQLRKITSSVADLSALMEFCTSLDSASEIREYLSQYLGSSPQVLHFKHHVNSFLTCKNS